MKTNRRRLMQGAVAIGASLAIGQNQFALAQTPVTTGSIDELKIAMSALPPQLDPQVGFGVVSRRLYPMIFDTLLRRDWSQDGKIVPALATTWTQVDDVTLEMDLRDDVVFHDGSPFTAADVKFSFDRSLSGDASLAASGYFPLKEVTVLGDHKVRFTTTGPSGAFQLMLTTDGEASIVPQAYFEKNGADAFLLAPVGTGSHKLTEYSPDTSISFEVNEQYWGGISAAKKVTVTGIPEVSTRIAALLNGEADIILDLPPDQVPTIQDAGDFTVKSVAPLNVQVLPIVGTNAPLEKKEIRQALSLAIDRGTIVDQLLLGNGVWPGSLQSNSDPLYTERPPLAYDPEKAKQLLADAGYAGEEIQFVYDAPDYYPLEQAWSEAIAGMWTAVGINVKMVPLDVSQRVLIDENSPYHLYTNSSGAIVDTRMPSLYGPDSGGQSLLPNEDFSEVSSLVTEAMTTVDNDARGKLYSQALDLLNDLVPQVVLFSVNRVSAMKPTITWTENPSLTIILRPGSLSVA